jgi:hypothetical protein
MIHRGFLIRIEDFSRRRWGVVFAVTGLLVAGSLLLATRLKLSSDILGMLPKNNAKISTYVSTIRDFGSLDYLLVMIEAPHEGTAEDIEELVDRFADKAGALPQVEYLEYRLDESNPAFRLFQQNAALFLDDQGLDRLAEALTDQNVRKRVGRLRDQLETPSSLFTKQLLERDPLGLAPIFLRRLLGGRGPLKVDLSSGYYVSGDGKAVLLIVKPKKPPQDVSFAEGLRAGIESSFSRAKAELAGEGAGESVSGAELKLGGGYIIAIEDSNLIKQDMKFNAIVSFLAVTGLYLFCYRRLAAIVYSTIPLLVGQALTFAVAVLFLDGLNGATAGFTAMLMGLGTDFTIVMYGRYVEERQKGASLATATHRMMGETALGVFTGAITSAGTFGAVCISRFPGLRDFGFLVGAGILLCLVAILFLLPAMIAWNEGRRPRKTDVVKRLYLHSFGVEKILHVANRWPKGVLAVCIVVTAIAGVAAWRIELSDSYRDLRSPNNRGFLVQEEIGKRFGGSFNYMVAVCHGKTESEALQKNRLVLDRLRPWVERGDVLGYESLLTYLPDDASQQRVIRRLEEGSAGPYSAERAAKTFRAALAEQGFREGAFEGWMEQLPAMLHPERALRIDDLRTGELDRLVNRYVKRMNGEIRTATFIFPSPIRWKDTAPTEFVQSLQENDPGIVVTGLAVVSREVKGLFRTDAKIALALGMLLVAVLLMLDFRSVRLTFYGLLQLGVGVVWMLGLMKAANIQMNFVNAFATTMILGVGIDYGIHLIHRIWEERSLSNDGVLETGKAVVMAALTNVAGFGTVALSNFPGIRSMGLVCLFGTLGCLATSLTLLPALMKLFPEPKTAPPPPD